MPPHVGSKACAGHAAAARIVSLASAMLLGGCAQMGSLGLDAEPAKVSDIATSSAGPRSSSELEKATAYWGEEHAKKPRDVTTALSYARNLKALGRKRQALSVLQATYMFASDNREFLSEYGRLALEMNQVSTAGELLARADDPAKPDWRVTSARGTVLAKQGRYKEAIAYYEQARQLAPEQASVMNNLAMAYTLDGQAPRGEELLRQANAMQGSDGDPRVAQNLALVMSLQGKAPVATAAAAASPAAAPAAATGPVPGPVAEPAAAAVVQTPVPPAAAAQPALPLRAVAVEARPAPTRVAAAASPAPLAADASISPDEIIRAAMAAEHAKSAAVSPR